MEATHVFTTVVNEGKLEEYRRYHDNIWPEVTKGLVKAGVKRLSIYLVPETSRLIMTITTASNIDLATALGPGSEYRQDPRCKEWEELMDGDFHGGWVEASNIHSSDVHWNMASGIT